jgi:hypothetical protein
VLRDFAKVIAASRATTTVTAFMVVDFMTNSPGSGGNRRDVATVSAPTSSTYQLPSYRASGRLGRFRAEVGEEKLLFNFFLDSPKPLFRAVCSLSPVLNLSHHFMRSVFGRSELHGKLMCKTHGAIAVFFRKVGRRSNLSDDGFPRVINLRNFILRLFFGHKFEHLFGCVVGTLIHD